MALRIRFQHPTGALLGYSVERLSDGAVFDFADARFRAAPATPVEALPEDSGVFAGRYRATLASTPTAEFPDGDFLVTIHDRNAAGMVVAQLCAVIRNGDDSTYVPPPPVDPWSVPLPGAYGVGTAGAVVGERLDAAVSSRSTYQGGPVESVSSPVTVGRNDDKLGYALAPSGMDSIVVEAGINVRQALAPILAAAAGPVSGAGTGAIVIRAAGGGATRITATTDNAGNRSSIDLNLPS